MAKNDEKLREDLANLFKAHGEMTLNMNPKDKNRSSKPSRSRIRARENSNQYLRGFAEDQIDVIEPEFKKPKLKNKVQMEQGKGPLAPNHSLSKKVNGKIINHKKQDIKKPKSSESQKSLDEPSVLKGKVKKVATKKQQLRNEGDENKKPYKHDKLHDVKLLGAEESEKMNKDFQGESETKSIIDKKNLKTKKGSKKVPKNWRQQDTCPNDEPKKRKLEKTNEPKRKGSKLSNNHISSKELNIPTKKRKTEGNIDESRFNSDSVLESDYDSDLDDTYELSFSGSDDDEYDYDSDDFFYDDDSTAESEASYCDYEDIEDDLLDGSSSDPDYELPGQEVEDLIVHKGLAVKYDLESHHAAEFDENTEDSHIVELPNQTPIKTITQHEAYHLEQLRKLELNFCERKSNTHLRKSEDDECPELVPINESDEGFNLWTSGVTMDDEMFSDSELVEYSDESSITSFTDLSRKYIQQMGCGDSSDMEEGEEEQNREEPSMQAFIIKADDKTSADVPKLKQISRLKVKENTPSLAEIIRKVKGPSVISKVKIVKAPLKNFGEKCIKDEKKGPNGIQNGLAENNNVAAEESMNPTEVEQNFSPQMDIDFSEEIDENSTDLIRENESIEIQQDQASKDTSTTKKCNLRSIFCNSMDSYYVLVLMKSPFFIYGTVNAKLIAGSIEVYGYKLKTNEMVTVQSPRGCCAIPFKPTLTVAPSQFELGKEDLEKKIFTEIKSLGDIAEFNLREVKEVLSSFDSTNDAILLLTRNETAAKIKHIFQQHINENIFPANIPQSRPLFSSEVMLDCMINATHENGLQIPSQWLDIHMKETSKLMLVGGKSVGKSSFLRYLLNKHLDKFPRILLIDLDIGQPEIFVPQTVSCALLENPLLGPGFFYQYEPDKAYAVGHTNLILCAHAYMRAVRNLLNFCKTRISYSNVPWLINTMGCNKGIGGELISVICSHLQPTDIIQIQSNKPINNFDMLFEPCVVASIPRNIYNSPEFECTTNYKPNHQLHIMDSAVLQQSRYQREWQMSAKDLRYIMQLARLSAVFHDEGEWINRSETFCHNLEKLKILNLIAPNSDASETLKSLESNLVYLCHIDIPLSEAPDEKCEEIQNNSPPECLGLGIVRAIDYQAKQVFILPAMPLEKLTYVNCLALGEMPLPSSLLTEQNPDSKFNVPFVQVMNNEATSRAVKQFFYRT